MNTHPRTPSADHGVPLYTDGPFKGKPKEHPYHTVLHRLARMGVNPLERQFDESDHAYVVRMNRVYAGQFGDIVDSGILVNKG